MKNIKHKEIRWARPGQMGFTLVELGITLTLIAALVVGGFFIVRSIRADSVRMDFSKASTKVMSTASKYIATYRNTATMDTNILFKMGAWDANMALSTSTTSGVLTVKSKIPGAWEHVAPGTTKIGTLVDGEYILYRVANVPKERCVDVITEMVKYPSVAGVYGGVYTNTSTAMPAGNVYTADTVATVSTASTSTSAKYDLRTAKINALCENDRTWIMAAISRD